MFISEPYSLRRLPRVLEIKEGGGYSSWFGAPFLLAGLFVIGVATRFLVTNDAGAPPLWVWPLLILMGAAFGVVGAALVFGRHWFTLDLERQCVLERWGFLVPQWELGRHPLAHFDAVSLRFKAGDEDSPDTFPVVLRARQGDTDLRLLGPANYQEARMAAAEVASFLRWPLVDSSTAHESVVEAAHVDAPLRHRLLLGASSHALASPVRPRGLRALVHDRGDQLRIVIPPVGLRTRSLLLWLVPLAFSAALMLPLRSFLERTRAPDLVQAAFLVFIGLFAGVLPFLVGLKRLLADLYGRTAITASTSGVTIERRGVWRTKTRRIPAAEIVDVDYWSFGEAAEAAKRSLRRHFEHAGMVGPSDTVERTVRRGAAFAGRTASKAVVVKTRSDLVRFGDGLSDEEARYVCHLVKQKLSGVPSRAAGARPLLPGS